MSNYELSAVVAASLPSPLGGTVSIPSQTITVPYQRMAEGIGAVPAGTTAGVEFDVDFGTVSKATGLIVHNSNAHEMLLKVNGVTAKSLPPNGFAALLCPAAAATASGAITQATLTTVTTQTAIGHYANWVFGDPT